MKAQTARGMCFDILALLHKHGYTCEVVNDKRTDDSVVEHDIDVDVVGYHYMFNMNINVNRICTRKEYVEGDEANPPREVD